MKFVPKPKWFTTFLAQGTSKGREKLSFKAGENRTGLDEHTYIQFCHCSWHPEAFWFPGSFIFDMTCIQNLKMWEMSSADSKVPGGQYKRWVYNIRIQVTSFHFQPDGAVAVFRATQFLFNLRWFSQRQEVSCLRIIVRSCCTIAPHHPQSDKLLLGEEVHNNPRHAKWFHHKSLGKA